MLQTTTRRFQPLGTCEGQPLGDYPSVETQILAFALAAQGDIDLTSGFPAGLDAALHDIHKFEDVFPWPAQNCEVFLELDLDFMGIALTDLDARWTTRGGAAALAVDFDQDSTLPLITGEIEGDVDCPSAIDEPFIQPKLPDDNFDIDLAGFNDLDIFFTFEVDGDEVVGDVEVVSRLGSLTITPALHPDLGSALGSVETIISMATGLTLNDMEDQVEDAVEAELQVVADTLADRLTNEVPANETLSEIVVEGGELVIKTTKPLFILPTPNFV